MASPGYPTAPDRRLEAVIAVAVAVVGLYLAVLTVEGQHGMHEEPGHYARLLSDDYDRSVYYRHGLFLPAGKTPYRDVFSEYPPIATLTFAVPFALAGGVIGFGTYVAVWSCLMALALIATIALVGRCRMHFGASPWPALILLGPSVLYFSLMRFDVLPAFLLCLSLDAFLRRRYRLAHVALALGAFTKWYPALAFPVYLARHIHNAGARGRAQAWRYGAVFVVTVAALTIAGIYAFTWEGFLVPYRYHAERTRQYFNLYWLIEFLFRPAAPSAAWRAVALVFFALQFSILAVLRRRSIASDRDVVRYVVLAVFLFIVFAKIDSPQWILWYLPPALMIADGRACLVLAGLLTVVNYVAFPLIFDAVGPYSAAYVAIVVVRDALTIWLIARLFREPAPTDVP